MTILILAKDGDRTEAGSLSPRRRTYSIGGEGQETGQRPVPCPRAAALPVSGAKSKKSADDTPVILKSVSNSISVGRQDTFSGRRCPFSDRKAI